MSSHWDPSLGPPRPDLSRLPLLDRERITRPVPLRPAETYGYVCVFTSVATNCPNGRINVAPYRAQRTNGGVQESICTSDGIQIDMADYSGKVPTATVILSHAHSRTILLGMLRAYHELGGDLAPLFAEAQHQEHMAGSAIYVEDASRDE